MNHKVYIQAMKQQKAAEEAKRKAEKEQAQTKQQKEREK